VRANHAVTKLGRLADLRQKAAERSALTDAIPAGAVPSSVAALSALARLTSAAAPANSPLAQRIAADIHSASGGSASSATHRAANALLKRYGLPPDIGRPRERICKCLDELQHICEGANNASELADALTSNDLGRAKFFNLEALLRFYQDRYGDKIVRDHDAVKKIEDLVGKVGDTRHLLELAHSTHDLPDKLMTHLEKQARETVSALQHALRDHWLPTHSGKHEVPAIARILKDIEATQWDSLSDDRAYLLEALSEHLHRIQNHDLDTQDFEQMHKLRRLWRWIPIFVTAVDGLVQLSDDLNPVPEYVHLKRQAIAKSKYVMVPPVQVEDDPVIISRSLYIAVAKVIDDLRRCKDPALEVAGLARAVVAVGLAGHQHKAIHESLELLGRPPKDYDDLLAEAGQIDAEAQRLHLAKKLRHEIRDS